MYWSITIVAFVTVIPLMPFQGWEMYHFRLASQTLMVLYGQLCQGRMQMLGRLGKEQVTFIQVCLPSDNENTNTAWFKFFHTLQA
jgi:hypothetical protein